jgi:hypothetical protein
MGEWGGVAEGNWMNDNFIVQMTHRISIISLKTGGEEIERANSRAL